ncbi:MAG: MBL fold metallo-hydrolase [Polyangiaceae bacterium]|nr:MBL fold metallo-hydrolase [Polyangiaceae bacterium]
MFMMLGAVVACSTTYRVLARSVSAMTTGPRHVAHRVRHPKLEKARLAVLWVGHATALIQLDDRLLLTDPVFTNSVGQLSPRLVEPGLSPDALPPVDAVVVSHMHFDHLSHESLDRIASKIRWLVLPTGGLVYLGDYPFRVSELGPWQAHELDGLRITAVPAKHAGWRYALDAPWMTRSAAGYVIEYHGLVVYFAGDTGFRARMFRDIARRFPHIDLALLPIAPISPPVFMRRRHLDPAQALDAFQLLGARRFVPIHFDTFINSTGEPGDAPALLRQEMARRQLPPGRVLLLDVGEQRVLVP